MARFHTYDPALVTVSWNGIELTGFADGTYLNVERTEDAFSMSAGASGDVTRVRNRNRSGTVTLTLQQESPSNDALSTKAQEDEADGTGVGPLQVKDLNGTTLCTAANAWVRKVAPAEYSKEAGSREWALDCAELEVFIGGSVTPS